MSGERRGPVSGGKHQDLEAQAVGWALSVLEPEEAASFAAHLRECDRCVRVVEETRAVMDELASAVPAVPPPPGLRARVAATARATEQDPPPGAPDAAVSDIRERRRSAKLPPRRTVAALVAAAVAGVVGFGVGAVVFDDTGDEAVVEALLDVGPATVTPVADAEGRVVATVVAGADAVQVVNGGMPVNDASDTTYVLWGLRDGQATALGRFDVTGREPELHTVADAGGDAGFTGYGISLEPGRTAPAAPTDVVATGDVAS